MSRLFFASLLYVGLLLPGIGLAQDPASLPELAKLPLGTAGRDVGNFRNIQGLSLREIIARIPADAVPEKWSSVPGKAEHGMKWKWVDPTDGITRRFWFHSPYSDPKMGPNANARVGWVARLQRGKNAFFDPKTGEFTNWKTMSDAAHNRAHIPIGDNPNAVRTVPRPLRPSPEARQTFQALDALADNDTRRQLTQQEIKKSGGAGRLRQELLGEKAPTGTYARRLRRQLRKPAQPRTGGPEAITNSRFSRPGPLNSLLEKPLSAAELDDLYREAANKGTQRGPVKLNNGQTWFVDRGTGEFRPLSGPGVVQLSGQEARHLQSLTQALKNGTPARDALQALAKDMARQGTTLTPEMARALKTLGEASNFTPDEIAAALDKQLPKLETVRNARAEMIDKARKIANGRPFKILKYGGRTLLAVGIAVDAYEIYVAENRAKVATQKAGAWGGALGASAATAKVAAPLLAAGPFGWVAYGTVVVGSGVLGYMLGENLGETVYDSVAGEPAKNGGGGW